MLNLRIVGKKPNGDYVVRPDEASREELDLLVQRKKTLLTANQFDPRMITRAQQMKAHALIRDINLYSDNEPHADAESYWKMYFCYKKGLSVDPVFSLANCSKELASQFIQFLVDYCFEMDIPFDSKDMHLTYDINRMMFLSALHNRCFATQARRQDAVLHIHHVNAVGRGKRARVDHRGRYYMILRAELHNEIHQLGYFAFCEKWHCGAIKLTDQQILDFGLMTKKQMDEMDADPDYEIRDWQLPIREER